MTSLRNAVFLTLCLFVLTMTTSVKGSFGVRVGGVSPADVNDEGVVDAADRALKMLNEGAFPNLLTENNLATPLTRGEIKRATSQVVSGMMYTLTMTVKGSNGSATDVDITLWSKPWLARSNDEALANQAYILSSATAARSQ